MSNPSKLPAERTMFCRVIVERFKGKYVSVLTTEYFRLGETGNSRRLNGMLVDGSQDFLQVRAKDDHGREFTAYLNPGHIIMLEVANE